MQALEHADIVARLRTLANESPDAAIYCVDPVGAHFIDIPAAARNLFRWSLSADSPIELMAADHRVAGAELFVTCRKTGGAEGTVRLADAPDTDVELHLLNGGDWVIGVAIDRPAVASVAVIHRNRVGRIVDVNEVTTRLLGRSRSQLLGARLDDFSHPEDTNLCQDAWTSIVDETDGSQHLRRRLRAEDGTTVWVEQVDKNALDAAVGVVITELTDVTEAALVQQRDTFRAALEERLDDDMTAVAYLRRDRTIDYQNARWGQLTGLAGDAPFYEFVAAVSEPAVVEAAITRTFGHGNPADATVTLRSHPRAPERRIRLQTRVLEGPDGTPGVVVALDEVPQVRLSTDGDGGMRRTDRARSGESAADAPSAAATEELPELPKVNITPPPPPPPAVSAPTAGGRRASDPPPDAGAEMTRPASDGTAPRVTPAIGTGEPAVPIDGETELGSTRADSDVATRGSRLAVFAGLVIAAAVAIGTRLFRLRTHPDWSPELEGWNSGLAGLIANGDSAGAIAQNQLDQPPGGPIVFAAGDWLSLETAIDLRGITVVVGVLGVLALFWAVHRWVGTFEAACAGVALALMVWHIHFSRLVVGEIFWPLLLTVGVGLLARPRSRVTWPIAGVAIGATVWFSHAAWLSVGAIFAVLVLWALGGRRRGQRPGGPGTGPSLGPSFGRVLAAAVPAGLVALPMALRLVGGDREIRLYGGMDRDLSGDVFGDWAGTWGSLMSAQTGNPFDASGTSLAVGWVLGLLALVGVVLLLVTNRSLLSWIVVTLAVVMPLGPALSSDESTRHALGLAPFLAVAAGVAAAWIARTIAAGFPRGGRLFGVLVIILLAVLIGWSTWIEYFGSFPDSADLLALRQP